MDWAEVAKARGVIDLALKADEDPATSTPFSGDFLTSPVIGHR